MSYAALPDLLARAGRLRDAWDETTQPSTTELEAFLDQTASEIDARIGAYGFSVPVTDAIGSAALIGVNADKALLLALEATWPGGQGPEAVRDLMASVQARVAGYDAGFASGDLAAVLYLASIASGSGDEEQSGVGASAFWTHDGDDYTYDAWASHLSGWVRSFSTDQWGVPRSVGPLFTKNMAL